MLSLSPCDKTTKTPVENENSLSQSAMGASVRGSHIVTAIHNAEMMTSRSIQGSSLPLKKYLNLRIRLKTVCAVLRISNQSEDILERIFK